MTAFIVSVGKALTVDHELNTFLIVASATVEQRQSIDRADGEEARSHADVLTNGNDYWLLRLSESVYGSAQLSLGIGVHHHPQGMSGALGSAYSLRSSPIYALHLPHYQIRFVRLGSGLPCWFP
jgi:hypothetical protein